MKLSNLLITLFAALTAAAPVPPIDYVSNVYPQGHKTPSSTLPPNVAIVPSNAYPEGDMTPTDNVAPLDGVSKAYPEGGIKQARDLGSMCRKFCAVNAWMCKFCVPSENGVPTDA